MKFHYDAYDRAGARASGIADAPDADQASSALRAKGLFVIAIRPAPDQTAPAAGQPITRPRRFSSLSRLKILANFTRQLSVLVSNGTPLVDALAAMERQLPDARWQAVVADIRRRLEDGSSLSAALAQHPSYFDMVAQSLIAAGESSGRLDSMLQRLADLSRAQYKTVSTFVGAMIYPILLTMIAVGVLAVMIIFVVPRFTGLFDTLGVPLPTTTLALIELSYAMTTYWYLFVAALLLPIGGAIALFRSYSGREMLHTLAIRAPQIGRATRSFATAKMARLLGVLLESKVPMLEALELTRRACTNMHYDQLLARASAALTRGESLSSVMSETPLIQPAVAEAVRSGERAGKIGAVLVSMADFLDDENEVILKSITSVIEPLILVALGLVVGVVAMSLFLPLFDLTAMAGAPAGPAATGVP